MKKKEIQAEIIEKINQLIDELQVISNDEIVQLSKRVKREIKEGFSLESALISATELLLESAVSKIFKIGLHEEDENDY